MSMMPTGTRPRWTALAVLAASLTLGGGPARGQDADIPLIKVAEVQRLLKQGSKVLLVDVRSNQEFLARHIKGAVSIPLDSIEQRRAEVPRQGLVVLY
jgi:hypothetical protein